jgi:hypothetical protein
MLARHRYTRGVNDVGLNAARLEPACQPEAVTAGLEGNDNAFDPASCFLRFLPPSMQQSQYEVEQSFGRPCRQTNGRSKRTCELTSSIVPRGTSFHHVGGIRVSPTGFDLALSCCCGFVSGPTEFGAVDDHAQSACPPAPPTAKLSPTSVFLSIRLP